MTYKEGDSLQSCLENAWEAVKKITMATPPEVTYYVHGGKERNDTGMTARQVAKFLKNDLSVIVVDPIKCRYYRAGKRIFNKKFKA